LHRDTGSVVFLLALRQEEAPEQLWKEVIQAEEVVIQGVHRADHMSEMQRFLFIEFEAWDVMLESS
jgi:hypothetical protein